MNRMNAPRRGHGQGSPEEQAPPKPPSAEEALIDPYQLLGLTRRATAEEIKKAYFVKVREFPPEREPDMFKKVRAAYDALRTPEAKAATDLFMLQPPPPFEAAKRAVAFDLEFHVSDWLVLARANTDLARFDFREDYRNIPL